MFKRFLNFVAIAIGSLVFLAITSLSVSALTPAEVQRAWAKQGTLSGTFGTKYADGDQTRGTFTLTGPTKLTMYYQKTGGQMIFDARGIQIIDSKFPQNNKTISDSRLGAIFSAKPSFAGYTSGKGSDEKFTMLVFRSKEGEMKVFFSNKTGRIAYLTNNDGNGENVTQFSYK
jgi:hypothetical protein